jgi:hypothetical protein
VDSQDSLDSLDSRDCAKWDEFLQIFKLRTLEEDLIKNEDLGWIVDTIYSVIAMALYKNDETYVYKD